MTPEALQAALGELGMKDLDELYEKIGLGERLAPLVARRLLPGMPAAGGGQRRTAATGHRRHRGAAGHLRALLLPDPLRSDLRVPVAPAAAW